MSQPILGQRGVQASGELPDEPMVTQCTARRDGLYDFADALATCLIALLGEASPGFGKFTVIATRESRDRIRLHVDGGIYSRIAHVGDGVDIHVLRKEGQQAIALVLSPTRTHDA